MPNLRKKDFQAIAAIVRDLREAVEAIQTERADLQAPRLERAFDSAAKSLAQALAPHNGQFNVRRFLAECGVKAVR